MSDNGNYQTLLQSVEGLRVIKAILAHIEIRRCWTYQPEGRIRHDSPAAGH